MNPRIAADLHVCAGHGALLRRWKSDGKVVQSRRQGEGQSARLAAARTRGKLVLSTRGDAQSAVPRNAAPVKDKW